MRAANLAVLSRSLRLWGGLRDRILRGAGLPIQGHTVIAQTGQVDVQGLDRLCRRHDATPPFQGPRSAASNPISPEQALEEWPVAEEQDHAVAFR